MERTVFISDLLNIQIKKIVHLKVCHIGDLQGKFDVNAELYQILYNGYVYY